MPWFTDVLRVVGTVTGATLIATGLASPLGGIVVSAGLSGIGNAGADAIEQAEARKRADEEAARKKQEADEKLAQQKRDADARAREVERELNQRREHEALPLKVIEACQSNQLENIPALLQKMDNTQLRELALTPLASCTSADAQQRVLAMLEEERNRRGL